MSIPTSRHCTAMTTLSLLSASRQMEICLYQPAGTRPYGYGKSRAGESEFLPAQGSAYQGPDMQMDADIWSRYCVRTFSGHTDWVREVVPSEDGRLLLSCSSDQVRLLDLAWHPWSNVAKLICQTARIWEFTNGETKAEFRGHEHVVECAVFAPVTSYAAIRELAGLQVSRSAIFPATVYMAGSPLRR